MSTNLLCSALCLLSYLAIGSQAVSLDEALRSAFSIFTGAGNAFNQAIGRRDGGNMNLTHFLYKTEKIAFYNQGTKIVGMLFTPDDGQRQHPAVTIVGPVYYIKEQSPVQYATRLAQLGFVTLIFDPRNHGESKGEPRRYESPSRKVEDIKSSITYLQSLSQVDPNRIAAIGICQGASVMLQAAASEPRIKTFALVTGNYIDRQHAGEMFGGAQGVEARLRRGNAARQKYERTGEVDYLPIVDQSRTDVGLPSEYIWAWYHGWIPRSTWENRYTVMSDPEILLQPAFEAAGNITQPFVMVHGEMSDGAKDGTARRFFDRAPSKEKKMEWHDGIMHVQFYDDPVILDKAAVQIYQYFKKYV